MCARQLVGDWGYVTEIFSYLLEIWQRGKWKPEFNSSGRKAGKDGAEQDPIMEWARDFSGCLEVVSN